jgi:hypothetical protein
MSTRSTERKSVYVEGQNFEPDVEGYIAVPENLGHMIMVLPGFTYVGRGRPDVRKPEPPKFAKAGDGWPEAFPLDDIWIEICWYVHDERLPRTVAELTRHLQQWCENAGGDASLSTVGAIRSIGAIAPERPNALYQRGRCGMSAPKSALRSVALTHRQNGGSAFVPPNISAAFGFDLEIGVIIFGRKAFPLRYRPLRIVPACSLWLSAW